MWQLRIDRPASDRARLRRHGLRTHSAVYGRGQAPQPPAPRRVGWVLAVDHLDPAAESGGVVGIHHGDGCGRPRHLRLHASRHHHHGAVLVNLPVVRPQQDDQTGPLATAVIGRHRGVVAPRHPILGSARAKRHSHDRDAHARQLSALGNRQPRAERYGHARPARHVRHVFFFYDRSRAYHRGCQRRGRVSRRVGGQCLGRHARWTPKPFPYKRGLGHGRFQGLRRSHSAGCQDRYRRSRDHSSGR